jgi:hypothetical protein
MKKNSKTAPAKPTLPELRDLIAANKNLIDAAKAKIAEAEAMILAEHSAIFDKHLAESGLTHGQHSTEIDGVKLTFKISQRVDWDSNVLESIANTLPWEQVRRIMKIEFSVPEKNFNALPDDELKDRLMDARTVKYAAPSVTFPK